MWQIGYNYGKRAFKKYGGVFLKKAIFTFVLLLMATFFMTDNASARSYSIDRVHIKIWLQENGDILVNEVFDYSFTGKYKTVQRSIQVDGHDGIAIFEAYLIPHKDAVPGFIEQQSLQPLAVTKDDFTFIADLPAQDEEKSVFFLYRLKNAINTYDEYSDFTLPLFGTGVNHSVDLYDVTVDVVFPQLLNGAAYYPFIHSAGGKVVAQTDELVRFHIPVSKKKELTQLRILYPSTVMTAQEKVYAPVTLQQAVQQEKQGQKEQEQQQQFLQKSHKSFIGLSVVFLMGALFIVLIRRQRDRGMQNPAQIFTYDPLQLYVIERLGKKDDYAFFAGVLSLMHRHPMTIEETTSPVRFYKDEAAPDKTLQFIFTKPAKILSSCDDMLVKWLFKRRVKGGIRIFSLANIYGATSQEKKEKKEMSGYYVRRKRFMTEEENWFSCVLAQMKEDGLLSTKMSKIVNKLLITCIIFTVIYATLEEKTDEVVLVFYLIGSYLFLKKSDVTYKRLFVYFFYGLSLVVTAFFTESPLQLSLSLFIAACAFLFFVIPPFLFSKEAINLQASIRAFKNADHFPLTDSVPLDDQLALAMLLRPKKIAIQKEYANSSPLALLLVTTGDPLDYLMTTWKISKPPFSYSSDSSSDGSYGDSGASSGGGDGGGGAGAD